MPMPQSVLNELKEVPSEFMWAELNRRMGFVRNGSCDYCGKPLKSKPVCKHPERPQCLPVSRAASRVRVRNDTMSTTVLPAEKPKIHTMRLSDGTWFLEGTNISWPASFEFEDGPHVNPRATLLEGLILYKIPREFVIVKDCDGAHYSVSGYIQYGKV